MLLKTKKPLSLSSQLPMLMFQFYVISPLKFHTIILVDTWTLHFFLVDFDNV
jgi:hypothetical protein